jgi:hypothetical protein
VWVHAGFNADRAEIEPARARIEGLDPRCGVAALERSGSMRRGAAEAKSGGEGYARPTDARVIVVKVGEKHLGRLFGGEAERAHGAERGARREAGVEQNLSTRLARGDAHNASVSR